MNNLRRFFSSERVAFVVHAQLVVAPEAQFCLFQSLLCVCQLFFPTDPVSGQW